MATDLVDLSGHEQVAFCCDPDSGLRAIIALHDTALGPGLGGTRFHPYSSMDRALADVLRLSRAMTSKNAVAGLDHAAEQGAGEAVLFVEGSNDGARAMYDRLGFAVTRTDRAFSTLAAG